MNPSKVLFLHGLEPGLVDRVISSAPADFHIVTMHGDTPLDRQMEAAETVDFIMVCRTPVPRELFHAARNVRLVQLLTAGYEHVDVGLLRERGIHCANNGGANSGAVAEHSVLLMLALYRQLLQADQSVRAGTWNAVVTGTNTFELANKIVGLVGFGNIGQQVAKRVQAFDATVQYFTRTRLNAERERALQVKYVPLDELIATSDVVSLHAPLTPETRNIVSRQRIQAMKSGAIVVNTSRGAMIDEAALFDALSSGHIAGAGLDVFAHEPATVDNPLFTLPNVITSPHSAGTTADTWGRRGTFAFANMRRVLNGSVPESIIL